MARIEVIINAGGGSFDEKETESLVTGAFRATGLDVNISLAKGGGEIEALARTAAASEAEIVVAGGGDGTISTVAAAAAESGKTLGVLPLGTLNHFSKDLGIPQTLAEAVRVIAAGHSQMVDVGEVNGRMFLNNSSIGLYPRIVRRREVQQERLGHGKWRAALSAAMRAFLISPFIKVRLTLRGKEYLRKTPFVFIGNNEYQMDFYNIGKRERLDQGRLSVYFLQRGGRVGVLKLLLRTVFGMLRQAKDFETLSTDAISIATRKERVRTAIDGESILMETPLEYRIRPSYLRVIVPRPEGDNA